MKKTAAVGMSGGVDSSVCAYLLKEAGYDVIGVTMQIWQDETQDEIQDNGGCCGLSAVEDARAVCGRLGIPHYVLNFKSEFKKYVIDYFTAEYLKGRTPNPCIACNRYVKWQALLNRAVAVGADYIATGHYAKVGIYPKTGRYSLHLANTSTKDQTYALYSLTQEQLSRTLMPVGEYDKNQIREIAEKIGLAVANKPDSQDICFVPDGDYGRFIRENTEAEIPEGNFVSPEGEILGRHKGITNYTLGQRKGFGLSFKTRMYITEIRPETNEIVLDQNAKLFKSLVEIDDFNFMGIEDITEPLRVQGKLRYSQKASPCTICKKGDKIIAEFDEPQRAPTPGQAAVFYDEGYILGGGTIIKSE
ncbi:MAG: tRNA 2-thiouridine(34) synthase MnmA [Clostridiales bacterium]|nr:tRNA 2-thiouridine(34) synthase MnmA [Clostridiales bacterium]